MSDRVVSPPSGSSIRWLVARPSGELAIATRRTGAGNRKRDIPQHFRCRARVVEVERLAVSLLYGYLHARSLRRITDTTKMVADQIQICPVYSRLAVEPSDKRTKLLGRRVLGVRRLETRHRNVVVGINERDPRQQIMIAEVGADAAEHDQGTGFGECEKPSEVVVNETRADKKHRGTRDHRDREAGNFVI